jgi:hypothetical protein
MQEEQREKPAESICDSSFAHQYMRFEPLHT